MRSGIPLLRRAVGSAALTLALAAPLAGQARDARLPDPGRLWLELSPTLLDWSEQFAKDPQDPNLQDGDREPLEAHFDGPIAARLFPGPDLFIEDLNADASALGFTPLTASDFSLGDLDFQRISAQVRRVDLGFELGVFDRLSVGVNAPFTLTDVEAALRYDSTTATVASSLVWLPPSNPFFSDARTALAELQTLIDGGTLTGSALDDAVALRDATDAFVGTLEGRAMAGALIPTGMSPAGMQMASLFGGFVNDFDALGIALPGLTLPDMATRADLVHFFEGEPIGAFTPGTTRNGLQLGEIEIGARFGILDQITVRTERAGPEASGPDPAGTDLDAADEDTDVPGIRFRTALGVTARIPLLSASFPPFANAADFLDVPIGDGQTDIELALFQDIAIGNWLLVRAAAQYGIQQPDELILRVAPPDRPYAFESLQTVVRRDLGDYIVLTVRPGLRLNRTLSIGLGYEYFRLGAPSFELVDALTGVSDAGALELEAAQTRQRVGLEFLFDNSESRNREEILADRRTTRAPWQFGVSIRRAFSGSGGRTPASFRFAATFRIPIKVF